MQMKYKKILILLVILSGLLIDASAQVPDAIGYQAAVRDNDGKLLCNHIVGVHISILQGSTNGTIVHQESFSTETNAQGLFTVNLGEISGLHIDWHEGPYFLKTEVDPEGGVSYGAPLVQEIVSVPFALYSLVADSLRGHDLKEKQVLSIRHDTIFLTGGSFVKLPPDFNGQYGSLRNKPTNVSHFTNDAGYITGEVQRITISNDTIFLTGGSFVVLPPGFSGDYNDLTNKPTIPTGTSQLTNNSGYITAESQVLTIGHDTIFLTGGSRVVIPFQTEVQNLNDATGLGNSAFSQLKMVENPTDPQDAVNKYYFDSVLTSLGANIGKRGSHNVMNITTCDTFLWHGTTYSMPGVYTFPYFNEHGMPSVDTLKLTVTVNNGQSTSIVAYDEYAWHDSIYRVSGVYDFHYWDVNGCPNTDTLHLTVLPGGPAPCQSVRASSDTTFVEVCGGITWYGSTIREDGEYEHNLGRIAYGGCDSIVKIMVIIRPVFQQDSIARSNTSITWRGRNITQQGDYGDTLIASNGCDSIYMLHLIKGGVMGIGAAPGLYSIANGVQVHFAQGNLRYQSSSNSWRFAEEQHLIDGARCEASYYATWADLFGWATSGYHDSTDANNIYYSPWSTSHASVPSSSPIYNENQYGYGPSMSMGDRNLTRSSHLYDWGQYNAIINGGNGMELWRLMSKEEWNYLLHSRNNAAYLHGYATIWDAPVGEETRTVRGYIILADNWVRPSGITFNANANNADENYYSYEDWKILEASGAVFLPMREQDWSNSYANYWTSSAGGAGQAYALTMTQNSFILAPYNRSDSYSVRLVQEHTAGVTGCRVTCMDTIIESGGPFSWHGYHYSKSGEYVETLVNSAGCDSLITLTLLIHNEPDLNGSFSVSPTHQVKFSRGNLQYYAPKNLWRFGCHQYDYIGANNSRASEHYDGWIDLFGWATSGWHNRADVLNIYYKPYDMADANNYYGPSRNMEEWNLVGTSAKYDWGSNRIANGGDSAGLWRTLTADEWNYLISLRNNAINLQSRATVNSVQGLILLPDNWTAPAGTTFTADADDFETNSYTEARWNLMEQAGAVFLPAAGFRENGTTRYPNYMGLYWSSTGMTTGINENWNSQSYYMRFSLTPIGANYKPSVESNNWDGLFSYAGKSYGYSVRLVKDL